MLIIPTQTLPNQSMQVQLDGQPTQLNVYQTSYGLFMDVYNNNVLVIGGVLCRNLVLIVRSAYLGYEGDFCWFDTQGTTDPIYTGIGARYLLLYLTPADITALKLPANIE